MKKKNIILIFLVVLIYVVLFAMSGIMAEANNIEELFSAFVRYYEIYIYVVPTILLSQFIYSKRGKGDKFDLFYLFLLLGVEIVLVYAVDKVVSSYFLDTAELGKIILKFIFSLILSVILPVIVNLIKNKQETLKKYFFEHRYFILFFIFLLFKMLLQSDININPWASVWLAMNYSDGLSSRLLQGTVLSFFAEEGFVSQKIIQLYIMTAWLALIFLVSYMLDRLFRDTEEKMKPALLYITILFLVMPGNIEFLWTKENVGRAETFTLVLVFLTVCIFQKINNSMFKYIFLSAMTVFCMASYQAYLFLYYPIIYTLMV